jgi:hypothetical protein
LNAKSALPATNFQWRRGGVVIPGATGTTLLLNNPLPGALAGIYSCQATTANGVYESAPVSVRVEPTDAVSRLTNLSIRSLAGSGNDTLIIGFAAGGGRAPGSKPLLLRATGPTLASFGVTGVLSDPALTIFQGSSVVATNDNWGGAGAISDAARSVGAFVVPDAQSRDAAIYFPELPSGTYTMHVTGNGNTTGTVLAEIYDATAPVNATARAPRLVNVSARNQVGAGDRVLIAGFVIAGATSHTVLIRGIGPALTALGVSGALADPKLELYRGSVLLAANDNWAGSAEVRSVAALTGAFELRDNASKDAALLVTLTPGAYTVQLAGADGGTGVGLMEIYDLPF